MAPVWNKEAEGVYYINTHKSEMKLLPGDFFESDRNYNDAKSKALKPIKLCIGDGRGTGRSPKAGRTLAESSTESIHKFIEHHFKDYKNGLVILLIGGGGGSGTGMAPVVGRIMHEMKIPTGIVYTLPLENEGIPTIPNALEGLSNLERELSDYKVAPFFIVDNELLMEEEGENPDNFWQNINDRIATIMLFTQLLGREISDVGTFNTIDEREFLRIFRMSKANGHMGYNDIKSFEFDIKDPVTSFREGMKETSMSVCSGYDYQSAEGILVAIEQPDVHKGDSDALNVLFNEISKKFKGKRILKSVIPSDEYRVNILFSAMNAPLRVKKLNEKASKLLAAGKKKREVKAKAAPVRGYEDEFDSMEL